MAEIIYTANLNTPGHLINFKNFYEDNEETIKSLTPKVVNGNKFYPLTLKIIDEDEKELSKEGRVIYLHIREKEKKHFMITSAQYNFYESYIKDEDVVIFINDEQGALNELEELIEYLREKGNQNI